ncbi:MAG: DUF4926 domain-containing protein [SAR324 cluster bacterium]|nr:DUF4926 domain-containing protein [SAR324 cluster bacterium]
MKKTIELLDVVALTQDVAEKRLYRGQVGTIVEILAPGVYEVEFVDKEGQTYAMEALQADQVLLLHYEAMHAA